MQADIKAVNRWLAWFLPAFELLVFGYSAYVITGQLAVNYLLQTSSIRDARPGAAVAVLVLFWLFWLLAVLSLLRIIHTALYNPGFVSSPHTPSGKQERGYIHNEKTGAGQQYARPYADTEYAATPTRDSEEKGLDAFHLKDVFACEGDGRPGWCSVCTAWKPERAHHCREVGRCVRKMDHFCPWAGGVISETNFKFFVQFVVYTSLLCIIVVVSLAICIDEQRRDGTTGTSAFICMVILLPFAAFFGIFTVSMSCVSLFFVCRNLTTIENISASVKVWTLAVALPRPDRYRRQSAFGTITYALASPENSENTTPETFKRTFAILHSKPGENPFDLGIQQNFIAVMGTNPIDWILPLRYSPCCDHSSAEGHFAYGKVVDEMKKRAGLT